MNEKINNCSEIEVKSDKAVVSLPQYLAFIDITQITKCLPCADVNARAYLLPWDPNDERTDGGGGAPGRPEPDGEMKEKR